MSKPQVNEFLWNDGPWNGEASATDVISLPSLLRRSVKYPFRKVEIKRRSAVTGLYETEWFDITERVEKFGTMQTSVDDTRVNQFVHTGVNITVRNDYGEFNIENDAQSLFYGYMTRVRTKVRVSAGYTDGAGNQFPANPVQGVYVLTGEINTVSNQNQVNLNCKSLISIFQETRADDVTGITGSMTASEIIGKIRDATDGSGNYLFQNFISSSAWDIQSTSSIITSLGTSTALEEFSVWELMNKLAEVETFVVYVTRDGGLVFANRLPATTDSFFSLYGAGYRDPNVIKLISYKEAVDKLFTHIRYQYVDEDTESSFVTAGTSTTVDVRSDVWKYGQRTYEFKNTFFNDPGVAQSAAFRILGEFSNLRSELEVDCVFLPHLELLDTVDISYREGPLGSIYVWDRWRWADVTTTLDSADVLFWASETSATIDFTKKSFKIISRRTNLDNFVTTLKLRESEG